MEKDEIKARLGWVQLYEKHRDAGYVCRRCGISRPTLRKWVKRYETSGIEGLASQSRRPHSSPNRKVNSQLRKLIMLLRSKRNLGARRIQSELLRLHSHHLSLAVIHKILKEEGAKPLSRFKRKRRFLRYSRPVPGDRVQIDTCKIAPSIYQYTAIDDCSRWRVR